MRFWQIIKSKFIEIIGDTRGEFRTSEADANESVINGVRYIVSTRFSKSENKTMKEKLSEFIGGDFAHLTTTQDISEIDEQASAMFSRLVEQMKFAEGITEQLKEENQIEWVARINNIEARVREIVNHELIFTA